MAVRGKLKEALDLSELILSEIEMNSAPLYTIALKASRLARLLGQGDHQQIMLYESSGYPTGPNGVSKDVWALGKLAGRLVVKKKDGVDTTSMNLRSLEQLESELDFAKNISPSALPVERRNSATVVSDSTKLIAERRTYIYSFVSGVYDELLFSSFASDVFDRTRLRVDQKIGDVIPDAVKRFAAVYENLRSENDEDWSNAVHSCRRILQDAADALYPAREDKVVNPGPKQRVIKLGADNYINRLIAYVEDNSSSERFDEIVGSHMKYLGERLDSIFQAAQKGSHNVISTQDEADRYVIYTYLVIGDILQLKDEVEKSPAPEAV